MEDDKERNLFTKPSHDTIMLPPIDVSTLLESHDIDQRGFSRKLHKLVSEHRYSFDKHHSTTNKKREKYEPKNWKKLNEREIKSLHPVQRSKFMVYEPAAKEILEKQMESLTRVKTRQQTNNETNNSVPLEKLIELEENSELIGQLKAAEARCRIRDSQMAYEMTRKAELQHLIKSQLTAKEAVRLQSFTPPSPVYVTVRDHMTKPERFRCECLLEDNLGLTVNRTS